MVPTTAPSCPPPTTNNNNYKVVILGDDGVGKHNLMCSILEGKPIQDEFAPFRGIKIFPYHYQGKDFYFWYIPHHLPKGRRRDCLIGTDVALLVYDLSNPETFKFALHEYRDLLTSNGFTPAMVIGTKWDNDGECPEPEALVKQLALKFIPVSAYTYQNIEQIPEDIYQIIKQ